MPSITGLAVRSAPAASIAWFWGANPKTATVTTAEAITASDMS